MPSLGSVGKIAWLLALVLQVAVCRADESSALFLPTEEEAASARWDLMTDEKEEIYAAVHIWEAKKIGLAGLAGLMEAAKRGAKVRLVTDALGVEVWGDNMKL